ncbi:Vps51/Vps67-domain-containing protein [Aspergillus egyptiacus]|nr:Vps51/Vps67-domain-containing protein [Aspergillus egyptiacus]
MASDSPDPQSLKSWQDAFQYPIPTVRRVEQELRRDIASNKEKLRALVGTRYRELVGTAETIVSMNREMEEVDTTLADIGRRCNPRLMGKKYAHFNQINGETTEQDATKRALAAQLTLLHRCTVLMSRMLRKRGPPLLVAKLLVICRLLQKTLSEQKLVPPFLETLRNQLASLKRGLRSRIDKCLARSKSTIDDVIEALAAYCLATSSSSDDAVAYYHKVRLDVIGSQVELVKPSGENILAALRLYVQTLQISKVILSRRFTDMLSKLKSRPLFTDPEIRNLDDLTLDVLERWVATDITNFTPWIKLNDSSKQDIERTIKNWSKTAFDEFMRRCQGILANWSDFSQLLQLRKETLALWLCSWSSTPSHSSFQVLEGLRSLFNTHLSRILSDEAMALGAFGNAVGSKISLWDESDHSGTPPLWDSELVSLDYSNGAATFKEAVTDRLLGRDEDVSTVLEKYRNWLFSIEVLREAIDALREVRWPDILDEAADEELDIDVAAILNEDDTELLREALRTAVGQAFEALQASFGDTYKSLNDSDRGRKAAVILKLVRLVRRDLPHGFIPSDMPFSEDIVSGLQEIIATDVITNTRPLGFAAPNGSKPVAGRTLWEGEPELPIQPSPPTFKYLRRLVQSMDRYGAGLWDASTVQFLLADLRKELAERLTTYLDSLESSPLKETPPTENGEDHPMDSTKDAQCLQDLKLQLYFDTMFLCSASSNEGTKQNPLQDVAEKLRNSLGTETGSTAKTMDQRAQEYWHRTRLLFGLLAADTA